MNILWHVGNVIVCLTIGGFLLAQLPTVAMSVHPEPMVLSIITFFLAYISFLIASVRSGKKTIKIARHLAYAFIACIVAFALARLPFIEGKDYVLWLVIIGFACLFAVSWISGRKRGNKNLKGT